MSKTKKSLTDRFIGAYLEVARKDRPAPEGFKEPEKSQIIARYKEWDNNSVTYLNDRLASVKDSDNVFSFIPEKIKDELKAVIRNKNRQIVVDFYSIHRKTNGDLDNEYRNLRAATDVFLADHPDKEINVELLETRWQKQAKGVAVTGDPEVLASLIEGLKDAGIPIYKDANLIMSPAFREALTLTGLSLDGVGINE